MVFTIIISIIIVIIVILSSTSANYHVSGSAQNSWFLEMLVTTISNRRYHRHSRPHFRSPFTAPGQDR